MLDALKPYPKYKTSGVASLGAIPASWQVRRNGRLFAHRVETGFPSLPILEVSIKRGVRIRTFESAERKQVMADLAKYKRACEGDIAYNMMRMWQGAVGVSPVDGLVSPAYVVARPFADVDPRFYAHVFRTNVYMDEVNAFSRGIVSDRNRLYWADFKQMPSVFPPPAEQAGIVRFLGAVDRKVNRFIRAKRRLIEVLTEQKQAIITHAVTRGLNPHAPLKPSGIDWLIPEHWDMLRAKYLLREVDERSVSGDELHLSMSQRHGLVQSDTMEERRLLSESYVGGKLCRKGDLVLNRLKAHLGVFAVAPQPGVISPDYTVLRPLNRANVFFYELLLRSNKCRPELRRRAKGIVQGFWRLYTDDFYDIRLPVPCLTEQAEIIAACDASTQEVNNAIETTLREIDLIREYRTRLVADVVTGKLDVRGVALPADAEADAAAAGADAEAGDAAEDAASDSAEDDSAELAAAPAGEEDA